MRKTRVGIVGVGGNGRAHIQAHLRVGKSVVVAACDRNPARLERVRDEFGIERLYSGDEIYEADDIDAISINTGDPFHAEPFAKTVERGKHVLVEKPLANTPEQVRQMVDAARAANPGLKIQVGYILRFNPVFEAVHNISASGELGRVFYMEADYIHNLFNQKHKADEAAGGNWYLDHEHPIVGGGSHQLDLLRWFCGQEVIEVSGYSNHVAFPEMANDDCQVALFRFEDGAIAKVACAYGPITARPPYCNLRVYGTKGTVERDTVAIASAPEDVHPPYGPIEADRISGHPFDAEVEDWLDAIRGDKPARTNLYDGANSTMACLMAVEAMRTGQPTAVPVFRAS